MRYFFLLIQLCYSTTLWAASDETATATAPQLEPAVGAGDLLQVVSALIFVIALIVITAWFIRRFSGATYSRNGALRLLAGISVGQRERVVLVQAGEVQLLLGVAPGEVRTLHVFDKPVLLDSGEGKGAERFAERLMSAMNAKKDEQA